MDQVYRYFGSAFSVGKTAGANLTLESANRIYVKEDFPLETDFTKTLSNYYAGQFRSIDFTKNVAAAKVLAIGMN